MTFFKVSFSADSLEGLTSLSSGLSASTVKSESVPTAKDMLPPSYPSSQNMEALDSMTANHRLVAPPPIPEEYGLLSGDADRNRLTPPAPPIQGMGISGSVASNADQVAPPPLPILDGMVADGHSFQTGTPPPPIPDSLIPNVGGSQAEEEVGPPPGPPKRQTKRTKKATKN